MTEIPRRICIDRQTPIEAAIRAAREAVESGPAHPHMTRATVLLGQALEAVADFVDGVPEHPVPPASGAVEEARGVVVEAAVAWANNYDVDNDGPNIALSDAVLRYVEAERAARGGKGA